MKYKTWRRLAEERAPIMLVDGRIGELVCVRRYARSCKIKLGNRHYNCWVDDIAFIETSPQSSWTLASAWPVEELTAAQPRLSSAPPSQNWLRVDHSRSVLRHPSVAENLARPTTTPTPGPSTHPSGGGSRPVTP